MSDIHLSSEEWKAVAIKQIKQRDPAYFQWMSEQHESLDGFEPTTLGRVADLIMTKYKSLPRHREIKENGRMITIDINRGSTHQLEVKCLAGVEIRMGQAYGWSELFMRETDMPAQEEQEKAPEPQPKHYIVILLNDLLLDLLPDDHLEALLPALQEHLQGEIVGNLMSIDIRHWFLTAKGPMENLALALKRRIGEHGGAAAVLLFPYGAVMIPPICVTDVAALATEITGQRAIGLAYRNLHGRSYFA